MARRSAPACSRCVANVCRSACGLMPLRDRGLADVAADDPIDAARGEPAAAQIEKQRLTARPADEASPDEPSALGGASPGSVTIARRATCARIASAAARLNGTSRSLPPLPRTRATRLDEVDVLEVETDEFAQPQPGRVEQLEDRAIAAAGTASSDRARRAADSCRRPADAPAASAPCAAYRRAPSDRRASTSSRTRYRANVRSAASRRALEARLIPRSWRAPRKPRTAVRDRMRATGTCAGRRLVARATARETA